MMTVENKTYEQAFQAVQDFILKREKRAQHEQQAFAEEAFQEEESMRKHWTLTQLHIISLISESEADVNNAFLAAKLQISKAAVTKSGQCAHKARNDRIAQKTEQQQRIVLHINR